MSSAQALPVNPFFASAEQRVALARQRFFEEGVRPSGMVSEAVIQSWSRCLRSRSDPHHPAVFEPVTAARVQSALRTNRQLLEAASAELDRLRETLAGTTSTAILTDSQGVIVGSTFERARSHEQLMPITTRIGVNLAEESVGTTAPGITARSGQACMVMGAEHFYGNVTMMRCAAAPIRDVRGQLAGVLDLSSEGLPFGFDAAAVVAHYAAEIENRLLCAQSHEHLVLRVQISPAMLDTPLVGLLGITGEGRIDWFNGAAARLLGLSPDGGYAAAGWVEERLGLTLRALVALSNRSEPRAVRLPNGLSLWLRSEWHTRERQRSVQVQVPAETPAPAPDEAPSLPPTTLRETEQQAVARVLASCEGNVSQAARQLGVSRGLIYRHLKQSRAVL